MVGYNLFLDDIRTVENAFAYMRDPRYLKLNWITVRNYDQFVHIINTMGIPALVSYDHDLADEHYEPETWNPEGEAQYKEKTGLDCAKYLISKLVDGQEHPAFLVHSWNPVGADNILKTIHDYEQTR